jgi:CheY-like chemotaxis protein
MPKKRKRTAGEKKMDSRPSKKKVLVVDNDDMVLSAFQGNLEDAGFETRTTWSGHEALALLQSNEFDVLLVDDYLPDLHSTDFLERLGRQTFQPWVVVMKGCAPTPTDLRRYRALGACTVVNKRDAVQVVQAVASCCADEPLRKAIVH